MQSLQYLVDLQLSTIRYYDLFGSFAALRAHGFQLKQKHCHSLFCDGRPIPNFLEACKTYFSNNVHAFGNFSKHNMFSIKPTGLGAGDKELAAVGVGAGICHREYTRLGMGQLEVLVFEPRTINGFATSTVVVGEVTTLTHEIWNHPVEAAALVAETLLTRAQSTEVFRRLGDNILPQLKNIEIGNIS